MKPVELDTLKNWFAGYTAGYLTKSADHDRAIHLKIDHTQRVCQNIIMLARAMNLSENDLLLAETMGLLHDIGKAVDHEIDGSHAVIGADIARRNGMPPIIVNAIEAHHEEVEFGSVYAVLVQVADAISGARPGARRETLESYLKRLEKLEEIAYSFEGVHKCFAIQGRQGNPYNGRA